MTPIEIISRLVQVHDSASSYFVRSDQKPTGKELQGLLLSLFTELALLSCISKAAAAQNDRTAEPNYPAAFAATPLDRTIAGLRTYYIAPAPHVTSTGAPYDHADFRDLFRSIWQAPQDLIAKAQATLLAFIRDQFSDELFSPLNPVFPASDLLAKYWMLATNRLQRESSDLTHVQDKLFSMPLDTGPAFHRFLQQTRSLEISKNIPASRPPFAPNPEFGPSLLSHLRKRADSVPVDLQTDFVDAVREFQRLLNQTDGLILPTSAITISLGALYPTSPSAQPNQHALRATPAYPYEDFADQPQFALVADQRQVRRDRRDVNREVPPVRQQDRDRPAAPLRPSSRAHDAPTAGSAQVQPTLASLEALLSQIQSAVAQLKNAEKHTAFKATPAADSPETGVHYALHARVVPRRSSLGSTEDADVEYYLPPPAL